MHTASTGECWFCMQKAGRCEQLRAGGRNKRVMILEEKGDVGCAGCAEPFPSGKLQSIKTVAKQLKTHDEKVKNNNNNNKKRRHTDHFHVCAGTHRPTLLHTNMEVSPALAISDCQYLKYAAQVCYIQQLENLLQQCLTQTTFLLIIVIKLESTMGSYKSQLPHRS